MNGLRIGSTMVRRELIRLLRQPARIAAAIGTPCLFWAFLAGGFADAMRPEHLGHGGFTAYLLPGMMTLVAVFGATFSSLSLIEDRNEGWLLAAIVSPAPRWSIIVGRIAGGAIVAWGQAALLLGAVPLVGLNASAVGTLAALAALALTSLAMTALGVAFAWRSETSAGFHGVMNLVFMPLWLLSGSVFPVPGAAGWMAAVTALNPLAWCTTAIRDALAGDPVGLPMAGAAAFALAAVAAAVIVLGRPIRRA